MAAPLVKGWIALQSSRLAEMERLLANIKNRASTELNKHIIDARIKSVNTIWSEARETHGNIIVRDDVATEDYIVQNGFGDLQSLYEEIIDELLTRQIAYESTMSNPSPLDSNISVNIDSHIAKLPKVPLPKFSGAYEDWESFCGLFTSLVHDVAQIPDATKLQYLKSCLTGVAADLIKDVAIKSENYASTWGALKARFYNPRLTVNNLLNSLLDAPQLKRESATDLRSFVDEAQRVVRALSNLGMPVKQWDVWLVHLLAARLDNVSRKAWELTLSDKDRKAVTDAEKNGATLNVIDRFPTFIEFSNFLENRVQSLCMLASESKLDKKTSFSHKAGQASKRVLYTQKMVKGHILSCALCSGTHSLWKCHKFRNKTVYDRRSEIRRLRLCFNCLGTHSCKDCPSKFRCSTCGENHHSLLHFEPKTKSGTPLPGSSKPPITTDTKKEASSSKVSALTATTTSPNEIVILATAQLLAIGAHDSNVRVRALLDQGAETSFITESVAQLLNLPKIRIKVNIEGLGTTSAGTARYCVDLKMQSLVDPAVRFETRALILPRLTSQLPNRDLAQLNARSFADLHLADPSFYKRNAIDLILGAEVYGSLLRPGLRNVPCTGLVAQNTALGWVVSGPLGSTPARRAAFTTQLQIRDAYSTFEDDLNQSLQKFWLVEEVPSATAKLKPEDEMCEVQFQKTHSRDAEGRFIVQLPLKREIPNVGVETRRQAVTSLMHLHRRFSRDSHLASKYREFMTQYEALGHMTRIPDCDLNKPSSWYIPHHAVLTGSQLDKKLRVVFDASRGTRDGHCLNDFLYPGPSLQIDLSLVLLNWRRYKFVFTADVVKMYRQINVVPEHQDYQRIVWAPTPELRPLDYRLNTVTYGMTSAPFLAIRTLRQLASDERKLYPLGAQVLERDTYVDDMFVGADDLNATLQKRNELIAILNSARMALDKWASNDTRIMPIQTSSEPNNSPKQISDAGVVKTLGLLWSPQKDEFKFHISPLNMSPGSTTKRLVLAQIARLYDPFGWVSPVIIEAKILMQDLWILKCDWDTPIDTAIEERWLRYCRSLPLLAGIAIPRWINMLGDRSYQLHGFADASSRAYSAVVYLRVQTPSGDISTSLLLSKSKVAPVKTISIPNLELCGAALLVSLIRHIQKSASFSNLKVFTWTDSQIVLTWLSKHPRQWKTFVANRVSFIQTELPSAVWLHVPSKENPADLGSRGCTSSELIDSKLWWQAPSWLQQEREHWPTQCTTTRIAHARTTPAEPELLTKYSSLTKLQRIVALCLRPLINLRRRKAGLIPFADFLTTSELSYAKIVIIRLSQMASFGTEISLLSNGKSLPKKHYLNKLNPIFDNDLKIIRVGGRLSQSSLAHESIHPPILTQRSSLSRLFVRLAHRLCLHGGPTLTCITTRRWVWILGATRLVKTEVRSCVTCQKAKPHIVSQLMGNLPADRVTEARPFSKAGLDYAGPIQVRNTKGRGHQAHKGYIVLFVCFSTRAVHLELVNDLSSSSFINAFRRFVSRRGRCLQLYSDNATTFHGADRELRSMFHAASVFYKEAANTLANDGTNWSFIPPNAPHYGGLWEAGIRSVKHHLKRVIGTYTFTYEELLTILVEIEACLNSRPLTPLSSDTDNFQVLTPAHFLIGEASVIIPDEDRPSVPENRLARYHLLQRVRNNFWKRWSDEYLSHLQERNKWRGETENFAVGQLVLLRDDRYPPNKWPLGRIIKTHPGPDNLVRVVSIKTATSEFRRHITKLCPLRLAD